MRECSYCGTHLSAPSRPLAGGEDLLRRDGPLLSLAGETELVQEGAERHLDGWMEVSGPAPVRFTNRYVIRETDRPFTLTWQSFGAGRAGGYFRAGGIEYPVPLCLTGPGVLRL